MGIETKEEEEREKEETDVEADNGREIFKDKLGDKEENKAEVIDVKEKEELTEKLEEKEEEEHKAAGREGKNEGEENGNSELQKDGKKESVSSDKVEIEEQFEEVEQY